MSWLLPSALGIAAVASIGAIALHFIARSRPLAEPLPTARFIPQRPVHARARSIAFTDLLLLLLRVGAILAIGLAVAGPMFGSRGRVARVVLLDRSRAVGSAAELRDSLGASSRTSDVVIPFDSAASIGAAAPDSVSLTGARGSLSAALAGATRAAVRAASRADSIELVLVSPVADEEIDDATARLRATWPGRIRVVRVRAAASAAVAPHVEVRADPNDAVAAGLSLMGATAPGRAVRVVRGLLGVADSAWARDSGHVLLHWPASDSAAEWTRRSTIDAIGGVTAGGATLVARFPRVWVLEGTAMARWADGEPAAVEHTTGNGCIRDVGVLIDQASDVTLRAPFRRFVSALLVPCGGMRSARPASALALASLAGTGTLASSDAFRDPSTASSPWTPWLLALGALLLIAELAFRRSMSRAA
ncbi:MAG: hypothetical protein JWM41_1064 [Gemmatimonadetes bacterium]|nr:hypothetical protein [Gemmatimonadota bacterium]